MSTGGADGPARPDGADRSAEQPTSESREPSAPWERPRRWARESSEATRVEDLLARLSGSGLPPESRRSRRDQDEAGEQVAAGDLIAALGAPAGAGAAGEPATPDAAGDETGGGSGTEPEPPGQPAEHPGRATEQPGQPAEQPGPATEHPGQPTEQPGQAPQDEKTGQRPTPPGEPPAPEATATSESPSEPEPTGAAVPTASVPDERPAPPDPDDEAATTELPVTAAGPDDPDRPADSPAPGDRTDSWQSVLASLQRQAGAPASSAGAQDTPPPRAAGRSHAPDGPAPRRPRWLIAGRSLVALFAVLLLLATGTEWVIKSRADAALADNNISALVPNDTNISTPTRTRAPGGGAGTGDPGDGQQPGADGGGAAPIYQAENILLMGSDTRASKEDFALGGSGTSTMQSDVLMIAHLSADRSHVTVVSIPRDLYIDAPTCKAWDYGTDSLSDQIYQSPYSTWKITNAYSVGGAQCTVRAVQQLTGLRINRVIIIDFAGFKSMVDALGGITINACRPIIDETLGTVIPSAGRQHIDGTQALELVRARKVFGDSASDLARIRRQQKVLSTILRQATSAGVLLNPAKLNSLLQAFVHNVRTDNVTLDDLLEIAQSLGNLDPNRVTFYTLPTVPTSDHEGLRMTPAGPKIWRALVNDQPLPGEITAPPTPTTTTGSTASTTGDTAQSSTGTSSPSSSAPAPVTEVLTSMVTSTPTSPQLVSVDPAEINLQVVNVAGRGGVATLGMNSLNPLGFDIAEPDLLLIPGDVRQGITVEYSGDNRAAAVTVAAAVPGASLVRTPGLGDLVRLMLGSSFDGTVSSVAVGSPVPSALSTTPSPVVSTVVTTRTVTPAALAGPGAPATVPVVAAPGRPGGDGASGLTTGEVDSVNAGNRTCI